MKSTSMNSVITLGNAIALAATMVQHARGKNTIMSDALIEQAVAARIQSRISRKLLALPVVVKPNSTETTASAAVVPAAPPAVSMAVVGSQAV